MTNGPHYGTCPCCSNPVNTDDFGYAVGHDSWSVALQVWEPCMGVQEVANHRIHAEAVAAWDKAQATA